MTKHRKMPPIPLIYRFTFGSVVVLALTIGVVIAVRGGGASAHSCLQLDEGQLSFLDVDFGRTFRVKKPEPLPQTMSAIFSKDGKISPDGRYIASLELIVGVDPTKMSKLHVEPAETDNSFGHITYAPYRNAVEISWSPDSHWIAYYWGGSPTLKYIAFAGLNGIQKQQGELPTDIWGMSFGGWSTDNKYLALELGQQSLINLSVWTVPDLQPINLGVPAPIATPNYVPFQGADSPYPSDVVWSKQGHKLAYFTGGGTAKRQLVILSLDEAVFRRFDLSPTNLYVNQFPYWSPDGNYIAIVSRLQQADRALLDIFSVDGTTHLSLGEVVISVIVAPEFIRGAGHVWTRDEKAIVYVRSNPQGTYDVVRYNVATRKEQLLLTTKQDIAIRSSPDNQSVAILTETGTYLDGGNGSTPSHSSLGRVKFNTIEWVNCD